MRTVKPKTADGYLKRAKYFYQKYFAEAASPTPAKIIESLINYADGNAESTWRFMRCALVFDQTEKGFNGASRIIKATAYPYQRYEVSPGKFVEPENSKRASKRGYAKSLNNEDEDKLIKEAARRTKMKNGQTRQSAQQTLSALIISRFTGVRPAELFSITDLGEGVFHIKTSKQGEMEVETREGRIIETDRGIDRVIVIDEKHRKQMTSSVAYLQNMRMRLVSQGKSHDQCIKLIEGRVYDLSKYLFPRRKKRPTLYTFRNQFASDLKMYVAEQPNKLSVKEMSYLMGHISTYSIRRYGKPGSGRINRLVVKPGITREEIHEVVRDRVGQKSIQEFKTQYYDDDSSPFNRRSKF
ncbi:hypothetical protein [Methylophaga sp.]|jgi:hypothetical protein|uniref:hypothetical protein n=1 Tax=Methylophaga sp. TaxID=2024840 RepID=UPI003F6FC56E